LDSTALITVFFIISIVLRLLLTASSLVNSTCSALIIILNLTSSPSANDITKNYQSNKLTRNREEEFLFAPRAIMRRFILLVIIIRIDIASQE
jgi:hypothetical protein